MKKNIYVFLFDGYSDWEISYLTPEIAKDEGFDLVYFSETGAKVNSMGGLQVMPTTSLNELKTEEVDMLILPGGVSWEKREITTINNLVWGNFLFRTVGDFRQCEAYKQRFELFKSCCSRVWRT